MKYQHIVKGKFLSRPNRFIALVELEGRVEKCHVKNTGRCKELLLEGATVLLERADENSGRKTLYDLVAVYKGDMLVNIDSNAPNSVAKSYLSHLYGQDAQIFPEKRYGDSRLDFYVLKGERRIFVEVKGVTLEREGIVLFPDAPTERGTKHLRELVGALKEGYEAMVLFVVQMEGMKGFLPNDDTDPVFGRTLRQARDAGVQVRVIDCTVTRDALAAGQELPLLF